VTSIRRALILWLAVLLCVPPAAHTQRVLQPVVNAEVACKDYDVLVYVRTLIATQDKARFDFYLAGDCIDLEPGLFVLDETDFTSIAVSREDRCFRPVRPTEYANCYWASVQAVRKESKR